MNFCVIREHREFFRKYQWIECDGVVSIQDQRLLAEMIPSIVAQRKFSHWDQDFALNDFDVGHDLWRASPLFKKIILNRNLSAIASELIEQKPLRFGYDSFFPAVKKKGIKNNYASFLQTNPTLEEMSCIQGVLCGAMVCLSEDSVLEENPSEFLSETTLFSRVPGNAVFFSPSWPLPLNEIYNNPGFNYLLIVYVKSNAVYFTQQKDPHLHAFKKLGYSFGDRLKEPFHPIVY